MRIKTYRKDSHAYTFDSKNNIFDIIDNRLSARDLGSTVILPYICANDKFIEHGFNGLIAQKYPIVKENFLMLPKIGSLGKTQFVKIKQNKDYGHSLIAAAMVCQTSRSIYNRKINYAALCYCMTTVKNKIIDMKNNSEISNIEIHCPKFGIGSSGGDWNFISSFIEDLWSNINTFVYTGK